MEESAMHVEFTSRTERWTEAEAARSSDLLARQSQAHRLARAVEGAGLDRLLIADNQGLADNGQLASFVLHNTFNLGVVVSHSAGVLAPQVAAQQFATLDQLSGGRLSIRIVAGDTGLDHEASLARTDEYLVLLKRLWANDKPFDHEGPHYSLKDAFAGSKPFGRAQIPFILGGLSGTAIKIAAKHADLFELPAGTVAEARQTISRVRAAAACHGRSDKIRFSVPVRPVIAGTRAEAWAKADRLGHDGEAIRLVGTAEQVALALLSYCDLGVREFVLHGLDQPHDLATFGRDVAAIVKRSVARQESEAPQPEFGEAIYLPFRSRAS
ncbi:LLM class flavin-dependent oxidoreductase [Mesorhizobium sp. DCY119]|jgi:alkanesulfonate monooxygenase|nr:LLM class flavin-dependent oxidoreductase [Mesorhizobium sp. DCY119]